MIFAYYDQNGILRETITVPVRVGDDGYDKVYLFFAGKAYDADLGAYPADIAEGSAVTSTFRNSADGVESTETFSETEILSIPFDPERDLKFFKYYTNYQFYVADVPTSVLATAGSVGCTPRQIYSDAHARAYGTLIFPVEGGVVIADEAVKTSEYDYLLTRIHLGVFVPTVSDEGIISWTNGIGLPNPEPKDITGPGVDDIEKISGTGAPGTSDTYRIYYGNGRTFDFSVANGANGEGLQEAVISDTQTLLAFLADHYDEVIASILTTAESSTEEKSRLCKIVRVEYEDDPDYGTQTGYKITYTSDEATQSTVTYSADSLPTGSSVRIFYGTATETNPLRIFTDGESDLHHESRELDWSGNVGEASKVSLVADSYGGSVLVTDGTSANQTSYGHAKITVNTSELTLPEKTGTLATLSDIPPFTEYVSAIPSDAYLDDYYYLPHEWEAWLTGSIPSKTWAQFLEAIGLTTDKTSVYVRIAYGDPFGGGLYNTKSFRVLKRYDNKAFGIEFSHALLYKGADGIYEYVAANLMTGTSIYAAGSSPFARVADETESTLTFNYGTDGTGVTGVTGLTRRLRYSENGPFAGLHANSVYGEVIVSNSAQWAHFKPDEIEVETSGPHYVLHFPTKTGTIALTSDLPQEIYLFNDGRQTSSVKTRWLSYDPASPASYRAGLEVTANSASLTVSGGVVGTTYYQYDRITKIYQGMGKTYLLPESAGTLATVEGMNLYTFTSGYDVEGVKSRKLGSGKGEVTIKYDVASVGAANRSSVTIRGTDDDESIQTRYMHGSIYFNGNTLTLPNKAGTLATKGDVPVKVAFSGDPHTLENALDMMIDYVTANPVLQATLSYWETDGGQTVFKNITITSWDLLTGETDGTGNKYFVGWTVQNAVPVQLSIVYNKTAGTLVVRYANYS